MKVLGSQATVDGSCALVDACTAARSTNSKGMRTRPLFVTGLAASIAVMVGCSSGLSVDHKTLAGKVKTVLENKVGQKARSVVCPDDLRGKVGATTRCTLEAMDGGKIGVTVTVTSVKGRDVKFDSVADKTPIRQGPSN